ncbi:MAG TPA: hypothetical protein DHV26_04310 [Cytophagales bacterium]|nr:hypothetical protein [Cytophagales bacterium]HRG09963.1 hypothetical protein [Cyclobacteriaceae bacterium]
MKFNSVKEYFYRLNNTGYQLMMVPLIIFIYHYASIYTTSFGLELTDVIVYYALIAISVLAVIALTTVHFYVRWQAQKLTKLTGLGLKLEKLGSVIMKRLIVMALVALCMPTALVLTHHNGFAVGFVFTLGWYFINWPTPTQISNLLRLKGDEKEMVLSKGEAFK